MLTQSSIILLGAVLFAGALKGSEARGKGFAQHRLLAYVVSSEAERSQFEAAIESWEAEIVDRDILMVNLGDIDLDTNHELAISEDEKRLWRDLWQLPMAESRFILVGKDGGAKAFQREALDLPLFFELIDQMPMRIAEMRRKSSR